MLSQYPRGSEWRRWELHIHTPETLKNDQFTGATVEEKWDRFYETISSYIGDGTDPEKAISVISITDYLSIDNYLKVKSDMRLPDTIKLIIPNVELRISPVTGGSTPINIHCLFDPAIDTQLRDRFFANLKIQYRNSEYSATAENLTRLGRDYVNDQGLDSQVARKKGAEQFVVAFNSLQNLFKADPDLRARTIIVVSNNSSDGTSGLVQHRDFFVQTGDCQLNATRQAIYQLADAIFSANPSDISYFSGMGPDDVKTVERKCGKLMSCFHGSDAHDNSRVFSPHDFRYCWLKADPTFVGLQQVLNEPRDRVYIGRTPEVLTRVRQNKTKYIDELLIDTIAGREVQDSVWFVKKRIPFNKELVAIIGNKGNGKSALADIIGLCGDSNHSDDFLFLNKAKFKQKGTPNDSMHD